MGHQEVTDRNRQADTLREQVVQEISLEISGICLVTLEVFRALIRRAVLIIEVLSGLYRTDTIKKQEQFWTIWQTEAGAGIFTAHRHITD